MEERHVLENNVVHYVLYDTQQRRTCEKYTVDGVLANPDGECYIEYDVTTGFRRLAECRLNGVLHSIHGMPSRSTYHAATGTIKCEQWHAHGALSNFPFAAEIRYAADGEWIDQKHYRNGKLSRLLGAARTLRRLDSCTGEYRLTSQHSYLLGRRHASHGAQFIRHNLVKLPTVRCCFNNVIFANRYTLLCSATMHDAQAAECRALYDVLPVDECRGDRTMCVICRKPFSPKLFRPEDTLRIGAGVLAQCNMCRQTFHLRCVEQWDAACVASKTPVRCSVCAVQTCKTPMQLTDVARQSPAKAADPIHDIHGTELDALLAM